MILSVENINKTYDRPVLKDISYTFESGRLYVIKGISGSGKSTLLNILGGVERNYEGSIKADGISISKTEELPFVTGYMFQYSLLLSNITVRDNLCLIKNDMGLILQLSQEFGVSDLLEKYPEQLSGGERQRISMIRALLTDPDIFLADEPTASLDEENSAIVAGHIDSLKKKGKIVIAATHEPYFDELADDILYLDYGKLQEIKRKEISAIKDDVSVESKSEKTEKINYIGLTLKRNPHLLNIVNLLPFMFVFLLILFVSTLQNSFEDEYLRSIKEKYPMDAFNVNITEPMYESFDNKDQIQFYDKYTAEENEIRALYLPAKEDSVLAVSGMLEAGSFPEKDDEVIISHELAENLSVSEEIVNLIGKEIKFYGRKFMIQGILFSFDENKRGESASEQFELYYNSDIYYRRIEGKLIFIPYDSLRVFGQLAETEEKRGYVRDLYDDPVMVEALRNIKYGAINEFDEEVRTAQNYVDIISLILLLVFFASFIMACIFMSSQIQTELFYKRRELGYLQIFGLTRKEIRRITFPKYILKISAGFGLSILVYFVLDIYFFVIRGYFVFVNLIHVIPVLFAVFILYFFSVSWTLRNFLKQDIYKLITE